MATFHFKGIMQRQGWLENVAITVDQEGYITDIASGITNISSPDFIDGYAIPGFQNAHSHAFQYAMAGLAERHEDQGLHDDFWSWREAMYSLALQIDPDQMEAIATMLYAEMTRHGYTHVAEFHYVHHDQNGVPYSNLAEMGSRLISAAKTVGMGITLVPIFYQKGGFGQPPNKRQSRFISSTIDDYLKLWDSSKEVCRYYKQANLGQGVHSMRGVEPSDIVALINSGPQHIPFHIHVSEQLKEVTDCLKYVGKRPVEWLLENVALDDRFHLVHATHLNDEETIGIAKSNANVVLCPSTEGNLGDGLFPLKKYQESGGKWSIGTDSHIGLNPLEELRILDYGQRLKSHSRAIFCDSKQGDGGRFALEMATLTGRKAMHNFSTEYFEVGQPLNACIFNARLPLMATTSFANMASTLVYAGDAAMLWGTIAHGKLIVQGGNHSKQELIQRNFTKAMGQIKNR